MVCLRSVVGSLRFLNRTTSTVSDRFGCVLKAWTSPTRFRTRAKTGTQSTGSRLARMARSSAGVRSSFVAAGYASSVPLSAVDLCCGCGAAAWLGAAACLGSSCRSLRRHGVGRPRATAAVVVRPPAACRSWAPEGTQNPNLLTLLSRPSAGHREVLAGVEQDPQHLPVAIGAWRRQPVSVVPQCSEYCQVRVDWVGLTLAATLFAAGLLTLDHQQAGLGQRPRQTHAVTPATLQGDRDPRAGHYLGDQLR